MTSISSYLLFKLDSFFVKGEQADKMFVGFQPWLIITHVFGGWFYASGVILYTSLHRKTTAQLASCTARAEIGLNYQDQVKFMLTINKAGQGPDRVRTSFCQRGLSGLPNTSQSFLNYFYLSISFICLKLIRSTTS